MLVKEIMKAPLVIDEDMSLREAAGIMVNKNVGCLIYIHNNSLEGIITDKDLLKHYGVKKKVSEVMSRNVITVDPEDHVENALQVMKQEKIKRLPVVFAGELIGILSLTDIAVVLGELEENFFFD
jgi:CBS domain-containing protein